MHQEVLDRAISFIKDARISVISTIGSDGGPHATVMHHSCLSSPLRIFYSADKSSTKYANILTRAHSAVVVGWSEQDWVTVQMRGTTKIVNEPTELVAAKQIHYSLHPNSQRFEHDPGTVFLKFEPTWLRFSDLGVEPPVIAETIFQV
jgi:general stress protein 26